MASSITGPVDVLASSGTLWTLLFGSSPEENFTIELVSESREPFKCSNSFHILPDKSVDEINETDLIIIPSINISQNGLIDKHPKLVKWIYKMHRQGATVAGICTGTFLLAETGLLDHKEATTHWAFVEAFREQYPSVQLTLEKVMIPYDGIYCVGSGSAWHSFVFKLIEDLHGYKVAKHAAKMFLLQNHEYSQKSLPLAIAQEKHKDSAILDAQKWIANHLTGKDLINRCSNHVNLNVRTFKHRFKQATQMSPLHYIQLLRIERSKEALELTNKTIEDISLLVGYQDSSFFRRLFKRETGISPMVFRKNFAITEKSRVNI